LLYCVHWWWTRQTLWDFVADVLRVPVSVFRCEWWFMTPATVRMVITTQGIKGEVITINATTRGLITILYTAGWTITRRDRRGDNDVYHSRMVDNDAWVSRMPIIRNVTRVTTVHATAYEH